MVWTDIIQMAFIFAGSLVLISVVFGTVDGLNVFNNLPKEFLNPFGAGPIFIIGIFLSTILAYFASQDIFQRVYAAKNERIAKKSMLLVILPLFLLGACIMFIGLSAKFLYPNIEPGEVIPLTTMNLVPVGLLGLVVVGYLSFVNSTSDSQLLTISSSIMRDFYGRKKEFSPKEVVKKNRIIVSLVGIAGLGAALLMPNIVNLGLSIVAWFGILGVAMIAVLFWKKVTSMGVFTSMTSGFGSAILYSAITGDFEGAMLVGLIPALILLIVVSLLTRK